MNEDNNGKGGRDIREHQPKYLGASDIVNGAANTFKIERIEMDDALKDIMKEIDTQA